jgi:hypothetical protein
MIHTGGSRLSNTRADLPIKIIDHIHGKSVHRTNLKSFEKSSSQVGACGRLVEADCLQYLWKGAL